MTKAKIGAALCALVATVGLSACQHNTKVGHDQKVIVGQDVGRTLEQQRTLRQNEPLPTFHDSAALHVQDAYYTADADPNKIWYVTLIALDGTPYAHFTTRGAPQPAGDQVTNPQQLYCQGSSGRSPSGCGTIGLPEPNGVHQGADNSGYVAILTTGAMVRIPSNAVISDQPFAVKTPIKLSIDETQAISKTDTSVTDNAVVPSGTGRRQK